jgi:glutathione S-transferase
MFYLFLRRGDSRSLRCALAATFVPHPVKIVDFSDGDASVRDCSLPQTAAQVLRVTGQPGSVLGSDAILRCLALCAKEVANAAVPGGVNRRGNGHVGAASAFAFGNATAFEEAQADEWLTRIAGLDVCLLMESQQLRQWQQQQQQQQHRRALPASPLQEAGSIAAAGAIEPAPRLPDAQEDEEKEEKEEEEARARRNCGSSGGGSGVPEAVRRRAAADRDAFLRRVDAHLRARTFLVGDRLTVADVALFASLAQLLQHQHPQQQQQQQPQQQQPQQQQQQQRRQPANSTVVAAALLPRACARWFRTVQGLICRACAKANRGVCGDFAAAAAAGAAAAAAADDDAAAAAVATAAFPNVAASTIAHVAQVLALRLPPPLPLLPKRKSSPV